ncbi:hypothetical protein C2S51_005104 [Perilla frutescens var. frutescens]|nr:hypothetical protein C2S51_005104 [Perilla frutescens var. frutescens]
MTKRQRHNWTAERPEPEPLRAGVAKLRVANWKNIFKDLELAPKLHNRTNIDLKDKCLNNQNFSIDDSVTKANHNFLECNAMIFEALTSLKKPRGSDFSAIADFVEQRHVVPENFRKLLVLKLRKLVREEKVEKDRQFYKIKDAALGTDTPTPGQKDVKPRPTQKSGQMTSCEPVDSAAEKAAVWVAEAENSDSRAAEAIEESERVSQMAEDAEAMFSLSKELFVHCFWSGYALFY